VHATIVASSRRSSTSGGRRSDEQLAEAIEVFREETDNVLAEDHFG